MDFDINKLISHVEQRAEGTRQMVYDDHGQQYLVVPPGHEVKLIGDALYRPVRKAGSASFYDVASLCRWVKDQMTSDTVIFATPHDGHFMAIIDYHARNGSGAIPCDAGWLDHTGKLTLQQSDQWAAWTGIHNRSLDQVTLGEFIEEHVSEIAAPNASELLTAVMNLRANTKVTFSKAVSLHDGTVQLTYNEEADRPKAGQMTLPENLRLVMPVYYGSDAVVVDAKLRVRLRDGDATFIVKLMNVQQVKQRAFDAEVKKVRDALPEVPLYLGAA